jgi:hypothetical protein
MQQFASKTTFERLSQLTKQLRPIDSTPDFKITSRRARQRAKQNSPTVLADDGIQIEINESQESKAEIPRTETQQGCSKTTVERV